ncbi:hypothetical protein NCS55_00485300 [Fusarium keratoplasticum]|nr:hypothetical protein NCS55_00485300 [Fusarium keratoplasticum]
MSGRSPSPPAPPSSPPSVTESESESESESDGIPHEPAYSPQELADIFLSFYNFLKTVHFQDVNLKLPPPGGWPDLVLPSTSQKSDRVYEVMRRLPYFDDAPEALLHYNSRLYDYTRMPLARVDEAFGFMDESLRDSNSSVRREMEIDVFDTFPFSDGFERGGKVMYLNVWDGEITQESLLMDLGEPDDARSYFDGLREDFERLRLIPCYNRSMIEAKRVPEHSGTITEEQIAAQSEEWGTDLDVQYIRQLYRGFGWPHAFRKDEAIGAVDQLMEKIKDKRALCAAASCGDGFVNDEPACCPGPLRTGDPHSRQSQSRSRAALLQNSPAAVNAPVGVSPRPGRTAQAPSSPLIAATTAAATEGTAREHPSSIFEQRPVSIIESANDLARERVEEYNAKLMVFQAFCAKFEEAAQQFTTGPQRRFAQQLPIASLTPGSGSSPSNGSTSKPTCSSVTAASPPVTGDRRTHPPQQHRQQQQQHLIVRGNRRPPPHPDRISVSSSV